MTRETCCVGTRERQPGDVYCHDCPAMPAAVICVHGQPYPCPMVMRRGCRATLSTTTPQAPVATLSEVERLLCPHELTLTDVIETLESRGEHAPEPLSHACLLAAQILAALSTPIEPADIRQGEVKPSSDAIREALLEALEPSGDTKAAYHGEFYIDVPLDGWNEDGEPLEGTKRVMVPWDTVKQIMAAILARATLAGGPL